MTYHYALPFPPSDNHYYRAIGAGRVVISAAGKAFRHDVWGLVREAGACKLKGRLEVYVILTMPDRKRRDIHNFCNKGLMDALAYGGAYDDDSQVDRLIIDRGKVEQPGCALVFIREITPDPLYQFAFRPRTALSPDDCPPRVDLPA